MLKIFKVLCNLLFFLLIIGSTLVYSTPVNIETAKQVAQNWYSERIDNGSNNFEVVETFIEKENSENIYCIFNFSPPTGGFVIVSADDIIVPILGYSSKQNFGIENHPPQFDAMLVSFKEQIVYAKENWLSTTKEIIDEWSRLYVAAEDFEKIRDIRGVSPMLDPIAWNQGAPWNEYCPEDASSTTGNGHVWVGCVAVSMAQVMKYWHHPVQGIGSHSYYHPNYGILSANFGATTYDWANMPNSSAASATKTLLYHCGVSVEMDYGPSGSAAWVGQYSPSVLTALKDYFNYDTSAYFDLKDNYSTPTWEYMIRNELNNGRPLVYRAYGDVYGHAFNLDGYQGTNYFHFNWGWSGAYNGYYYLSNLNPGGFNFNTGHGGIFNLLPISNAPDWQVIAGTSHHMVLMAEITLNGEEFEGSYINMAGAFCWTDSLECRGVAVWESGAGFWYFDIVSNVASGEEISFKIYDFDTDTVYDCNETIIFEDGTTIGSPIDPYSLTSTSKPVVIIAIYSDNVVLTWGSVSGATDYNVYYSTDPYTGFTELTPSTGGAATYTHTGGATATKYFYRVTALNGGFTTMTN